eukprot:6419372-Amphidinium_carterae.1
MAGKKRPLQMLDDLASKRSSKSAKSTSPPSTSKASSAVSAGDCMSLLDGLAAVIEKEEEKKKDENEVIPVPIVEKDPQTKQNSATVFVANVDDSDDEPPVPTELAKPDC